MAVTTRFRSYLLNQARQNLASKEYGAAFSHYLLAVKIDLNQSDEVNEEFLSCMYLWTEQLNSSEQYVELTKAFSQAKAVCCFSDSLMCALGEQALRLKELSTAVHIMEEAKQSFSQSITVKETWEHMSYAAVERWHFKMLNDFERNKAYHDAIVSTIQRDNLSSVLDIGCGTGLLSVFAEKGGAQYVTLCDADPVMTEICSAVLASHRQHTASAAQLRIFNARSTSLTVPDHIPERVDLVVTEIFDAALFGEHCLATLSHAWSHLLHNSPHRTGRVIPRGAQLYVCAIECPEVRKENSVQQTSIPQLDLSGVRIVSRTCVAEEEPYTTEDLYCIRNSYRFLSPIHTLMKVDFNQPQVLERLSSHALDVILDIYAEGTVDALAVWFDLELCEGVKVSTGPSNECCWEQAIFPVTTVDCGKEEGDAAALHTSLRVNCGDQLKIHCTLNDGCLRLKVEDIVAFGYFLNDCHISSQPTSTTEQGTMQIRGSVCQLSNATEICNHVCQLSNATEICNHVCQLSNATEICNHVCQLSNATEICNHVCQPSNATEICNHVCQPSNATEICNHVCQPSNATEICNHVCQPSNTTEICNHVCQPSNTTEMSSHICHPTSTTEINSHVLCQPCNTTECSSCVCQPSSVNTTEISSHVCQPTSTIEEIMGNDSDVNKQTQVLEDFSGTVERRMSGEESRTKRLEPAVLCHPTEDVEMKHSDSVCDQSHVSSHHHFASQDSEDESSVNKQRLNCCANGGEHRKSPLAPCSKLCSSSPTDLAVLNEHQKNSECLCSQRDGDPLNSSSWCKERTPFYVNGVRTLNCKACGKCLHKGTVDEKAAGKREADCSTLSMDVVQDCASHSKSPNHTNCSSASEHAASLLVQSGSNNNNSVQRLHNDREASPSLHDLAETLTSTVCLQPEEVRHLNDLKFNSLCLSALHHAQSFGEKPLKLMTISCSPPLYGLQALKSGFKEADFCYVGRSERGVVEGLTDHVGQRNAISRDRWRWCEGNVEGLCDGGDLDVVWVDVVEMTGCLRAGVVNDLRALRSGLRKDAMMIPQAVDVYAILINSPQLHSMSRVTCDENTLGVSIAPHINPFQTWTFLDLDIHSLPHENLSDVIHVFHLDFQSCVTNGTSASCSKRPTEVSNAADFTSSEHLSTKDSAASTSESSLNTVESMFSQSKQLRLTARKSGNATAMVFWFDQQLAPGVNVSTVDPEMNWRQAAFLLNGERVEEGREVVISAHLEKGYLHFGMGC